MSSYLLSVGRFTAYPVLVLHNPFQQSIQVKSSDSTSVTTRPAVSTFALVQPPLQVDHCLINSLADIVSYHFHTGAPNYTHVLTNSTPRPSRTDNVKHIVTVSTQRVSSNRRLPPGCYPVL